MTSLILDGIVVLLFAAIVIFYTHKGFIASLVGMLRFWIATGVATLFSPRLSVLLQPLVEAKLVINSEGDFFSTLLQKVISSGYLAKTLAFILIFVAVSIVIKLVELILNAVAKLPLIKFLNRTLGLVMGLAIGFFWVELLVFASVSILSYLQGSFQILPEGTLESTTVVAWIYEHNIFNWIVEKLLSAVGK